MSFGVPKVDANFDNQADNLPSSGLIIQLLKRLFPASCLLKKNLARKKCNTKKQNNNAKTMNLVIPNSRVPLKRAGWINWSVSTPGRRQSKTLLKSMNADKKIARNSVFDCHLSAVGRQMAIENSASNDF